MQLYLGAGARLRGLGAPENSPLMRARASASERERPPGCGATSSGTACGSLGAVRHRACGRQAGAVEALCAPSPGPARTSRGQARRGPSSGRAPARLPERPESGASFAQALWESHGGARGPRSPGSFGRKLRLRFQNTQQASLESPSVVARHVACDGALGRSSNSWNSRAALLSSICWNARGTLEQSPRCEPTAGAWAGSAEATEQACAPRSEPGPGPASGRREVTSAR